MFNKFIKKYFWVFTLVVIAAIATLTADGTANLVVSTLRTEDTAFQSEMDSISSKPGKFPSSDSARLYGQPSRDGTRIMQRNIFDSVTGSVLPGDETELAEILEEERIDAGIQALDPCEDFVGNIFASIAAPDSSWSFVGINDHGETFLYREGMPYNGNEITKITWRYVFFSNGNGECYVDLWEKPEKRRKSRLAALRNRRKSSSKSSIKGIKEISPTKRRIERSLIQDAIKDPQKFVKSVRVLPYEKNGKVEGYKFYGIRSSSALAHLGLKNGDVVHSINGVAMTSPDQALAAYGKLSKSNEFEIKISRRGKPTTLEIEID